MKREISSVVHLLALSLLLWLPLLALAQGKKVSLTCDNMALTTALQKVEEQSDYYHINYNSGDLSSFRVTTVIQNQSAPTAVNLLLKGLPFAASVKDKTISINRQGNGRKGTRTISGRLFDSHGEPLIGASVREVGTKAGTVTDVNGHYELHNVSDDAVLEYTYIGMKPYRRKASDKPTDIILEDDANTLGDVVVTGMQTMDRRLFTGASTKIDANDAKLDGVADISRSLEGRAAGVSVQNVSGTFGTAPKIRVRGATSIYGSSKPLWVVDGVIMEDVSDVSADALSSGDAETLISSAIAGLNADDIESFQILKDGSATSIYGARAMAGVIVVTTKKGKAGQAHIGYSGEFTSRLIPSYSQFNILNSQDQMSIYKEMKDKGWLNISDVLNGSDYGVYGKMYELINTYDASNGQFGLPNIEESRNAYLQQAEYRNTNWFKELFSNAISQNHSVSLSGGTQKSSYYVSMSAMIDPGWYKDSKVNRYTLNANVQHHILDNLTLNLTGAGSYRKQKAPGTLSQDVDVVTGKVKRDFDINPYSYALNTSRVLDPDTYYHTNYAPFNILHELATNYIDLNVVDTKFQAELKWTPLNHVDLSALGAVKYAATSQEHRVLDDSNQAQAYRAMPNSIVRDANKLLYTDPANPHALPISVLPEGGIYQRTDNRMLSYDFRATAAYRNTFNKIHIVNLFGGMETNGINRERTWFNGWGMQYKEGEIPFYTYQFFKKSIEENTTYYNMYNTRSRTAAFFANGTYSYKGRYNINGTIRYEGTNKLGKSRSARWLPTWNISGSWNTSEEKWFQPTFKNWLTTLTLKASYSLTADRGPADYTNSTVILNAYTPYRLFSSDKESGIQITQLENSELTYEKKHELNLGLDAGFLNNRINVTLDIYWRNNYDLIGPVNTEGVGGEIIRFANMASMRSHGEELSISTHNIRTRNFNWDTNFIYSHTKNKVTDLMANASMIDLVQGNGFAKQGYPVRALFSIPFEGLNKYGEPTFLTEKGDVTAYDINFQERTNTDYLKYEGPTDPTYTGSLGNIFTYKNFKLNIFVTYSFGNVVRLDPVFSATYNDLSSMTKDFKNRWMAPGDEDHTNVPAILSYRQYRDNAQLTYGYNAYNYSHERIAKGDFIRMKEIALSYDFPHTLLSSTKLSDLSLKLQATNLFLIYADKKLNGQDPEFMNAGGVASPMPRQFTLTLKFGL